MTARGSGRDGRWQCWGGARPEPAVLHLDTGAAGRSTLGTLQAVADHARREAETGGYVAEAEAAPTLEALRTGLAGLTGVEPDGVAITGGATAARDSLLDVWPLAQGARIGVLDSAWGPNLQAFEHRGLGLLRLTSDQHGVVDLDALDRLLTSDPPDVLHLEHVAAHRGLVQPIAEVVETAARHGVPLWVDAAQSLGHVACPSGADAVYGTSRKWLTGPRGVGVLSVARKHHPRLVVCRESGAPDRPTVQLLEPAEAHVAGRVGLAHALAELAALGPAETFARLAEVGALVRAAVDGVPGWEVAQPEAPAGALTGLRATAGQDVGPARTRLLAEHGVLTTAGLPWRAPREMSEPLLRVSPHVDLTDADLERLCSALAAVAR